jgi:TonB family protein
VATSAACHAVTIVALFLLAHGAATGSLPRASRAPMTFVALLPAPDPARLVPLEPIEPLRPSSIPTKETPAEVVPQKTDPPPAPEIASAPVRAITPPAPELPKPPKPIAVEAPRPAPPLVTVGAFPSPSPVAHAVEPPRAVQQAGFDAPAAHAPEVKLRTASVGAFDQAPASARPQAGSDRPNIVADAGFGVVASSPPAPASARVVADAGFGSRESAASRVSADAKAVRSADFDVKPAAQTAASAPREARVEIPLEILSKPTPAYTDEARSLKIEGDVILDVNFSAAGDVEVLHVVRGLGHGLDEAAARAAQGMRFKPARSAGRPVDFRTTVHIVFRLA